MLSLNNFTTSVVTKLHFMVGHVIFVITCDAVISVLLCQNYKKKYTLE